MIGKKFNQKWVIRAIKDEELVTSLRTFCFDHQIKLGSISGIGACKYAKIGILDIEKKEYASKEFTEDMEITSLIGNVSTKDDEIYLHLHIALANKNLETISGHLTEAIISATSEIIIDTIDGTVNRYFDKEIGINLLSL